MPTHVYDAAAAYAVEVSPGFREGSTSLIPNTIQDLEFDVEQEFDEAFGAGSDIVQGQALVALRYPIRTDMRVHSGQFLIDTCQRSAGILPSVTFEFCDSGAGGQGDAYWGVVCNTLRLSATQRGILTASIDWLAKRHVVTSGFGWEMPNKKPYVWAKGIWTDATQGSNIHPIGIDITLEQNVQEQYAMLTSVVGDDTDYEASHLLPGYMGVRADIRAIGKLSPVQTDNVSVVCTFVRGSDSLTLTLSGGTYRGQQRRVPEDDMVEYGVPYVFRNLVISATEA